MAVQIEQVSAVNELDDILAIEGFDSIVLSRTRYRDRLASTLGRRLQHVHAAVSRLVCTCQFTDLAACHFRGCEIRA